MTETKFYDFDPRPAGRYHRRARAHAPCIVCVPAKNEARRLPGFLSAMTMAFRELARAGDGPAGALVVALDGCTDDSREILEQQRRHFPVDIHVVELPAHPEPHAGRVRRAALEHGARLFPVEPSLLFTTDADTWVDRNWLVATRALMGEVDVVCGDIWRDDNQGNVIRAPHEHHYHALHRARRRIDPVAFDSPDPHPQGFGASIAMRRDVYHAIGGCPSVPSDEDTSMVLRARQRGYRVRQDRSVRVLTSSRRTGRARGGLAEALVREDADARAGRPFLIVDPRRYLDVYRQSAALRTGFARNEAEQVERAVSDLRLDRLTVEEAWRTARSADAFVSQVLPEPDFTPDLPLHTARAILAEEIGLGGQSLAAARMEAV
ncbi:MAG: glycosyltransferase family 2 protein [Pseudomonadota bacterium]